MIRHIKGGQTAKEPQRRSKYQNAPVNPSIVIAVALLTLQRYNNIITSVPSLAHVDLGFMLLISRLVLPDGK